MKILKQWIAKIRRKQRERAVIQVCGCVTYCPKCNDILNDQAYLLTSNGEGLGTYKCRASGHVSEWHFGIAPVPLLVSPNPLRPHEPGKAKDRDS